MSNRIVLPTQEASEGRKVVCVWVHPNWGDDFTLYRMYDISTYKVGRDYYYHVRSDRGFPRYLRLGVGSYQVANGDGPAAEFIEVDDETAMHTSD